jgi:hypothetical protein
MGAVSDAANKIGGAIVNVASSVPVVGGFLGQGAASVLGQPSPSSSSGLDAGALVPGVNLANANPTNAQIADLNGLAQTYGTQSQQYQQAAQQYQNAYNQAINSTQNQIGNTQGAIQNAQGQIGQGNQAYNEAQAVNQQVGGSALNLLQNAALGNSPSAAQAQLQSGLDQSIATQRALANSGNVSGMVANQKEALDNAAQLTQSASNQAAQLRANQQVAAQGLYGTQATNVAAQAGANANTANALANTGVGLAGQANTLAGTQANVAGLQQNAVGQQLTAGQNYANLENTATQNAGTLAANLNATQQQAYNAHQLAEGQAIGGIASGAGSAASAGLLGGAAGGALGGSSGIGGAAGLPMTTSELTPLSQAGSGGLGDVIAAAYKGGIVPSGISSHEDGNFVHRHAAYAKGGFVADKRSPGIRDDSHNPSMPHYVSGGKIPGKPEVDGDSLKNDKVHVLVSPGEIVIPRSHSHSIESAVEFLQELMNKKKEDPKKADIQMFLDAANDSKPKVIENGKEINDSKEKDDKVKAVKGIVKEVSDIEELMNHLSKKKKK